MFLPAPSETVLSKMVFEPHVSSAFRIGEIGVRRPGLEKVLPHFNLTSCNLDFNVPVRSFPGHRIYQSRKTGNGVWASTCSGWFDGTLNFSLRSFD